MFFQKHDSKKCPNCSFPKAHLKITNNIKTLNCYYCGYHLTKGKDVETIELKRKFVIFRKNKNIDVQSEHYISSDLEWFINEYLLDDGVEYLNLEGYELLFADEINDNLLKELKQDIYHYVISLNEDNKYSCISCGDEIVKKMNFLKGRN